MIDSTFLLALCSPLAGPIGGNLEGEEKIKHSGPDRPTLGQRPTGTMPGMPDGQSTPAYLGLQRSHGRQLSLFWVEIVT